MNRSQLRFIIFLMHAIMGIQSHGQVVINEVMSSNFSAYQDENGKYDDWIEIYNAGAGPVDISGYGLSDNENNLFAFTFPSMVLAPQSRVVVFASDENNTLLGSHWESAVRADHNWRYQANVSAPADSNWRNISFNENTWSMGQGGIGNGDSDDATVIPSCTSLYMRKTFMIPDTSKIMDAVFNMDFDDGFVAYLNGVEIARANIGFTGLRPQWNDFAHIGYEAQMYQAMPCDSFHIDQTLLHSIIKNGMNVLAVEVHNQNAGSNDMTSIPHLSFKMKDAATVFSPVPSWFRSNQHASDQLHAAFKISRTGEALFLTNAGGIIIDQVSIPPLEFDNSFGRSTDGSNTWNYFETATPNAANILSPAATGYATIPMFSLQGGFYSGTQTLTLTTAFPGGVIRYTKNGDLPTSSSTLYTGPISIPSTKTIRARVFSNTSLPSTCITNTYFINLNCKLPVYSLALDSADLWDYNEGIFVLGPNANPAAPYFGANFWQDWQKYMSLEYFDKQKSRVFRFNAGLSVTGGWSRRFDQKSLEVNLGDKYGLSKIQYDLIPDKKFIDQWDDFLLHTSGNDRGYAHMRDPVMERLMKGTYSDYTAYEPCILFINGQLWGIYYTKENEDHNFIRLNYGYDKDEIDLLKESYLFPDMEVKQGDDIAFRSMHAFAMNSNPVSSTFYAAMDSMIDLRNQVDYFAAECYYPNDDWMGGSNNNLKIWRPRKEGGRFRYILYDLDFGFGMYGSVSDDILSVAMNPTPHNFNSDIFQRLLQNHQYKNYFINRYADLINTVWQPSNVMNVVKSFRDSMRYDMHFQYDKWGNGDTNTWKANINNVTNFSNVRPAYARNQIQTNLGMAGQVTLTLQASPAGAGRIKISTITPQTLPWSGVYFNGNPVTVTAIPNPGYTFNHWQSGNTFLTNDTSRSTSRNFTVSDVVTAYFTGSSIAPQITISEINYNSDSASNAGDWIELHNMTNVELDLSGWKLRDDNDNHEFVFPVSTVIAPNGYLVIAEDMDQFHSQHAAVSNVIGETGFNLSDAGDQLRLYTYYDSLFLSIEYSDQDPWPIVADGDGYTLERNSSVADPNNSYAWFAGCIGGSPGRAYAAPVSAFTASGPLTICMDDTLTLSATQAVGNVYQWLLNNQAINGATNTSFVPDTTGYYKLNVSNSGCTSISDSVSVMINPRSDGPVTSSAFRCGPGSVSLNAMASDVITWYDAQYNQVGSGSGFTTPSLSQTTIYYAQAGTTCPSAMIADTVSIFPIPANPSVTGANSCGHGVFTLTASSNSTLKWYDAPNGGLVGAGDTLITPDLNQTTTYYVQAGEICPGNFIPVTATVHPVSPDPIANSVSRCNSGSVTLYAACTDTVRWYDAPNGNLIHTGNLFQTPVISLTTTYYLKSGTLCESNVVSVQAIISSITPDPVVTEQWRCGSGTMSLTASATDTLHWYDAPNGNLLFTGSNFTTPYLNSDVTYYVRAGLSCPSNAVAVEAQVLPVSTVPFVTDVSRCGNGSVELYAVHNDTVKWYDAPNGNLLQTGNTFLTPILNSTNVYHAQAGTKCPGPYVPASAIITTIPGNPVADDQSRCGQGTVTLNATSPDTIRWYDSPGGNLLSEGSQFSTSVLNYTTTYYVRAENVCSGTYVPVKAIVNSIPPDAVTANQERCGEGSVTLLANAADTLRWYDQPNGNLLAAGNIFTTPLLQSDATYYVRAEGICQGNYMPVTAIINPLPAEPVTADQQRCGPGQLMLNAAGPDTIRWYDAPNGILLAEGNNFTTPVLSQTTTYAVRAEENCMSQFVPVHAIIKALPADPAVMSGSTCGIGTVVLTASSPDTVYWYDIPNGTRLGSGVTYTTPVLTTTTTYFAEAVNGCESNLVAVNAYVFAEPMLSLGNDTIIESGSTIILDAGAGFSSYLWNNGETSQTVQANSTGNYWVTVTDGNGCSVTDTLQVLVTVNVQPYVLSEGVLIYPNPTHSSLSVSFMNENVEDVFMRLIGDNGKIVWTDISTKEHRVMRSIDLDMYARGLYVFQISTSATKKEFKIILK